MSTVPFARPLFAASVVGAVAVVAAVATLFSGTPLARGETIVPTRTEAKSCTVLCSWDDLLPTTSTFSGAFTPPGLLSFASFTDCIGCLPSHGALFNPAGLAFGLSKLKGNSDAPGRTISEAARELGGNAGSANNPGAGVSNVRGVGLQVATSVTSSVTPGSAIGAATGDVSTSTDVPVTTNPEPGTVALLATALFVLVPVIRRQRRV